MTPERYKKLTDWLEGRPALREGIILLNRWLPLVPFVCYPALLLLLNLLLGLLSMHAEHRSRKYGCK